MPSLCDYLTILSTACQALCERFGEAVQTPAVDPVHALAELPAVGVPGQVGGSGLASAFRSGAGHSDQLLSLCDYTIPDTGSFVKPFYALFSPFFC